MLLRSDLFTGTTFAAVLQCLYFAYVRLFSHLGMASISWVCLLLLLTVLVSIYFGIKIRSLAICLFVVVVHWFSMFTYDIYYSALGVWEIWQLAKQMSLGLALHVSLQCFVAEVARRSRKER